MKVLDYFFDWGIYEGDILAAGGEVDYTGEVIYRGYGYIIEGAHLSLNGYMLHGYMKRFHMGNAVLCSYGENDKSDGVPKHKKIAKCDIALALNDMDRQSADFFECRLVRDCLLWIIAAIQLLLIIVYPICFYVVFSSSQICRLVLTIAFFLLSSLLFYLRMLCKSKNPATYKARFWTDKELQSFEMPSDEELLKEKGNRLRWRRYGKE